MKAFLYATLILLTTFSLHAQVGIGTTSPASGALLDLNDPNRGLLVPRVTIAALGTADPVTAPTTGLLVWNIDVSTGVGFHYWNGAAWVPIGSGAATLSDAWLITGNTNIVDGTHFIGTGAGTDVDVAFRRNNLAAGKIGTTSTSFGLGSASTNTAAGTTAIGVNALAVNTAAKGNTAIGSSALGSNNGNGVSFQGENNTAVGINSLGSNTTGRFNVAIGSGALSGNTAGEYNIAIGSNSQLGNGGSDNIGVGVNTLLANTASGNTAIGHIAMDANTSGTGNVAVGYSSLGLNTIASNNTALGSGALAASTAANNTAVGNGAGSANTKANSTFLGYLAGSSNSGDDALIIGYQAGTANSGAYVTTVGNFAGRANAGIQNTYIGYNAGALLNTGNSGNNVAVGFNALQSGNGRNNAQNTAIGTKAMENIATNANNNTAVGYLSGTLISGSNNVLVGNNANVSSGSNSTAVGYGANCGAFSNSIALGNGATATQSNHIRIGNGAITLATTSNAWTVVSDIRMKSNIIDSPLGLDFVNTLRPVSYFKNNDNNRKTEYGFVAQEVETALINVGDTNNGIVHIDSEGNYSLRYNDFIPMTVKAVQEQQVLIEKLQKDNEELKAVNAAILKRLEVLEEQNN